MEIKHKMSDLEKVKEDGLALEYVKEQTPEICWEAVRQNGLALEYVKEQTPEICLEAVRQSGDSVRFVDDDRLIELLKIF